MLRKAIERWVKPSRRSSPLPTQRFMLRDNCALSDAEFMTACSLCDIAAEVIRVGKATLPGGIFWGEVDKETAHGLHLRKDRKEIDVSILLRNRFRDFPTIIYEYEDRTPAPDYWVRRYLRLCAGAPKKWHVRIPARFGEIGWDIGGFPVNRHTAVLQERINALLWFGMNDVLSASRAPRVLEVGGGSGEMAYAVCSAVPGMTWYDCDLTQSLIYNAIHMAVWLPKKRHYVYVGNLPVAGVDERLVLRSPREAATVRNAVVNIPHFLLNDFRGELRTDIALNYWSFSEMPASEVQRYGEFIRGHLSPKGMLVEQNGVHAERGGCNAKEILEQIFAERRECLPDAMLPRGGIRDGAIDAWAVRPPKVGCCVSPDCFDDKGDTDDFRFEQQQHFLLLREATGLTAI